MARPKGKARLALHAEPKKPFVENIKVSKKQAQLITDLETQINALGQQRQTVLNTIAAAAQHDGECHFIGPKQGGENFYVVLQPVMPADPGKEG